MCLLETIKENKQVYQNLLSIYIHSWSASTYIAIKLNESKYYPKKVIKSLWQVILA